MKLRFTLEKCKHLSSYDKVVNYNRESSKSKVFKINTSYRL